MSEADDFEWNEVCAKIAYEEEKLVKGQGTCVDSSVVREKEIKQNKFQNSLPTQPYPGTFEPFSSDLENQWNLDKISSRNLARRWKEGTESISSSQHPVTTTVDLESIIARKQGEISILRERLSKLEREKFEAIEACRLLQQDSHKRNSSSSCNEEINRLQAEILRLRRLNEFYHQEISSLEMRKRESLPSQEESNEKYTTAHFGSMKIQWSSTKEPVAKRKPFESASSAWKGKAVLEEFETVVNELNQHGQNRSHASAGFTCYEKEPSKQMAQNEGVKSYSFQTAVSLHISPSQKNYTSSDVMHKCTHFLDVINALDGDDLVALKRLVLHVDEQFSSNLVDFMKLHPFEEGIMLQNSPKGLDAFIETLLQILESDCSVIALENASKVFYSMVLKKNLFPSTCAIADFVSLERILSIIERIMKEPVALRICLNVIEGCSVILEEMLVRRVSAEDIESLLRLLKNFLEMEREQIFVSAHSLLLHVMKLVVELLFSGEEYLKSKRRIYSDSIFHLMMSFLSCSSSCLQCAGIYFGYKLKDFLAFSLEVENCISLIQVLICTFIREYLMLSRPECSLMQRGTSWSSLLNTESLQDAFFEKRTNSLRQSDAILYVQYSLQTLHFMIHRLKERGSSLNFLLNYSVPLLSVLKAIIEDQHQNFPFLKEASEIWSVVCSTLKSREPS